MRLALDTNRYTDLCRGDTFVLETVERADEICLRFIVVEKSRAGFAVGNQRPRNEAMLRRLLMNPACASSMQTSKRPGVYRQLGKHGTHIPTNDIWIAALVMQHSLALFARDKHFEVLAQLLASMH